MNIEELNEKIEELNAEMDEARNIAKEEIVELTKQRDKLIFLSQYSEEQLEIIKERLE